MATMKGWEMEEEAQRMQGRLPGGGGGGGAGAAPTPQLSAPERFGGAFRNAVKNISANTVGRGGVAVADAAQTAMKPVAKTGAALTQFTRGLMGSPAPRQAQAPRTQPTAPAAGGGGTTLTPPPQRAPAPAPAPAPSGPAPGSANTFTFSDGRTVPVESAQPSLTRAAPAAAAAEPAAPAFDANAAVAPAVAGQRAAARLVRNDATRIINPASQEAELLRRAENAAGSTFLKGRPGARNAVVGALLGQIEAGNTASSQFQRGVGEALNEGASGAVRQGLGAEADAARSRFQREGFEQASTLQAQQAAASENAGREVVGADGRLLLRRGTTAAPVMDENGQAIRMPAAQQQGQLTPQDLLKAYTAEREAIAGSLMAPEEKAAALAAIDANPLFAPIVTQAQPAAEPPAAAIERLRANPEAAQQFDEVFGQGASARYLGN